MTQLLFDKSSISDKTWRGNTDSPGLWIAIIVSSVALHLLLFWWMYAKVFSRFQQHSSSVTAIELVDISPKSHSKTRSKSIVKRVSPNRQSTTRRSVSASLPKQVTPLKQVTPENLTPLPPLESEDRSAIAFAKNKQAIASQHHTQARSEKLVKKTALTALKHKVHSEPINKPELTPLKTPQTRERVSTKIAIKTPIHKVALTPSKTPVHKNLEPTPSPKTPDNKKLVTTSPPQTHLNPNPDTSDPQDPLSDQQNQHLPLSDPIDPTSNSSPATGEQESPPVKNGETIKEVPKNRAGETPRTETPHPMKEAPQTPTESRLLATWNIEPNLVKKDIPDNPAQPIDSSREKPLSFVVPKSEVGTQLVKFQVLLIIDNQGNLVQTLIPDPRIAEPKASQYLKYAQAIFKDQKFIPASSNNGTKPSISELYVQITIQPQSH